MLNRSGFVFAVFWTLLFGDVASLTATTNKDAEFDSVARGRPPLASTNQDLKVACVGRADGAYPASACSEKYVMCRAEDSILMQCSKGLVFNADSLQCDFPEHIVDCKDAFDCVERTDGIYSRGCSQTFWYCSNGVTSLSRCPEKLFFDIASLRCEYKDVVPACGGSSPTQPPSTTITTTTEPTTTAQPTTTTSPPSSTASFTQSAPFHAFVAPRFPSLIGKEGFSQFGFTAAPFFNTFPTYKTRTVSTTELPRGMTGRPIAYSFVDHFSEQPACGGRDDGKYSIGKCMDRCLLCVHGKGVIVKCAAGLVFSRQMQQCVPKNEMADCTTASSLAPPDIQVHQSTTSSSIVTSTQAAFDNEKPSCSLLKDGPHEMMPCYGKFITCSNGATSLSLCSAGLVFNGKTSQCDYPHNTAGCSEFVAAADSVAQSTTKYVPVALSPLPTTFHPAVQLVQDAQCAGHPDRAFVNGCSAKYTVCSNGIASEMTCAAGLAFNADSGFCDYNEFVPACGGVPSDSVTSSFQMPSDKIVTQMPGPAADVNECANRPVGLFANECSQKYFACSNGIATSFTCPFGLAFNVDAGLCDYNEFVPACGGVSRDSATTKKEEPSVDVTQMPTSEVSLCAKRADGVYADGCSEKYVVCSHGMQSNMICASGLAFNVDGGFCDFKEAVPACGGSPKDFTATTSRISSATVAQAVPSVDITHVPTSEVSLCAKRADGAYADGCSEKYVVCSNEMQSEMICPSGLAFNIDGGFCDFKEAVPACGGSPKDHTATTSRIPPTSIAQAVPIVDITQMPASEVSLCAKRADGAYADGCSEKYVVCSNGIQSNMVCPSGLAFNTDGELCDYKEAISACGGSPRATTLRIPSITVAQAVPSVEITQMPTAEVSFCAKRADGAYADGCSEKYVVCSNGIQSNMACPSGLAFNTDGEFCDFKEAVPACGGLPMDYPTTTSRVPSITIAQPTDALCAGRPNMAVGDGCSERYFICWNERSWSMMCPTGLVFDSDAGSCARREFVIVCGGLPWDSTTTRTPTTTEAMDDSTSEQDFPSEEAFPSTARPQRPRFEMPYYVNDGFDVPHHERFHGESAFGIPRSHFVHDDFSVGFEHPFFEGRHNGRLPPFADLPLPPFVGPNINGIRDAYHVHPSHMQGGNPFTRKDAPIPPFRNPFASHRFDAPAYVHDNFLDVPMRHGDSDPFDVPNFHGHVFDQFGAPEYPPYGHPPHWPTSTPDWEHSSSTATSVSPSTTPESETTTSVSLPEETEPTPSEDFTEPSANTTTATPSPTSTPVNVTTSSRPLTEKEKEDVVVNAFVKSEVTNNQPTDDGDMEVYPMDIEEEIPDDDDNSPVPKPRAKRAVRSQIRSHPDEVVPLGQEQQKSTLCRNKEIGTRIAMGFCLQDFILCSSEDWSAEATCLAGELFDSSALECVPAETCGRIPRQGTTAASRPSVPSEHSNSPNGCARSPTVAPSQQGLDSRCDFTEPTALALGFCRMDYLLCLRRGVGHISYCVRGYLFDHSEGRCLPAKQCGSSITGLGADVQETTTTQTADPLCNGVADGATKDMGECRNQYYVCQKGVSMRKRCLRRSEVFSRQFGRCVLRELSPECRSNVTTEAPIHTTDKAPKENDGSLCNDKPDGMYRHPENCSRIIQCFGGDAFEYPPCADGLAFNELSGGCDYKVNVAGCDHEHEQGSFRALDAIEDGCGGLSHGDFLADLSNRSVYHRCVWGRLVMKQCPFTTVFNAALNICDHPNQ